VQVIKAPGGMSKVSLDKLPEISGQLPERSGDSSV
jgi:hypothetical protein